MEAVVAANHQTSATAQTTVVVANGGDRDSGSEVGSDEGYRSLGVATTPPAGEKRSVIASVRDNEASGRYKNKDPAAPRDSLPRQGPGLPACEL